MKILFLTDNFPPETNAPASRTFAHCKIWQAHGHEVTVITCFPNFPRGKVFKGYRNKRIQREVLDGINVIRIWTYIAPNAGTIRRTIDYISFGVSSFLTGLSRDFDILIGTSPQFFTAIGSSWLARLRRKPWIMEVRDIWPASIVSVGAIKHRSLIKTLEKLEMSLYRHARNIVVVTDSFKTELLKRGVPEKKVFVVKNGVDTECFDIKHISKKEIVPARLAEIRKRSRFLMGYVGTHGMAHDLQFVLRTLRLFRDPIDLVFIGDGAAKKDLEGIKEKFGMANVHFFDPIDRSIVPSVLTLFDTVLVPLKNDPLFRTVIPSKIFESAAMGVPIFLGVEGEAKSLVERYGAGISFIPGDAEDFLSKLRMLYSSKEILSRLGEGGLALAQDFDRKKQGLAMLQVIEQSLVK